MSTFELYLLMLFPSIGKTAVLLSILTGIGCIISAVGWSISSTDRLGDDIVAVWRKAFKIAACTFAPAVFLATLMPNEMQMAMLIAYELGSNVNGLSELPADVVEYLRALLDSVTGELSSQTPDSN